MGKIVSFPCCLCFGCRMLYWAEGRGMMASYLDGSHENVVDNTYVYEIFALTVDSKG